MSEEKKLRLTRLEIDNVKRIKMVRVTLDPDGNVVLIRGDNGAGKSSALDAIHYLVGGKDVQPPQVIRSGEHSARVLGEFAPDDLVIERKWTEAGTTVEVRSKDGAKYPSPQKMIDRLMGPLRFDPSSFLHMDGNAQAEALRKLTGVNFDQLDAERVRAYSERTTVNTLGKEKAAKLKGMPAPSGLARVEVGDLLKRQEELHGIRDHNRTVRSAHDNWRLAHAEQVQKVAELERKLEEGRKELERLHSFVVKTQKAVEELQDVEPQLAEVQAAIAGAETTNSRVAADIERATLEGHVEKLREKSKALTARIAEIDAEKAKMLAEAEMPVPGLGFNADGITLNGVPFVQASQAEKLRVAFAMWLSAHPKLAVAPIADASLFDKKSLALIAEMAEKNGVQVLLEVVGDGDVGIVFEDGEVVKVNGAPAPKVEPEEKKPRKKKPEPEDTHEEFDQ